MLKISGIGDWFSVPQAGQEQQQLQDRTTAITQAIQSLSRIQDPQLQQIIAQLQTLMQ